MKKRNIAKINQKKIRTTIIIIILLAVFEIFEICVYNKVFNKNEVLKYEKNIVALNNSFYDIDYLLVNKYITIIRTSEQKKYSTNELTNPYMIQIKNNIVYVANDLNLNDKDIKLIKASGIEGTPKVVKYLNYESRSSFYVLTKENDLYYADTTIKGESNIVNQFQKINDKKITNIYDFYTDENITYPWSPLTIYGETENKGLLKVKLDNITTTFKEDYALLDQICGGWSEENYCVGLFISPDRNLYLMKDEIRKTYKEILYKELEALTIAYIPFAATIKVVMLRSPTEISNSLPDIAPTTTLLA